MKFLLLAVLLFSITNIFSQDLIVTNNGDIIKSKNVKTSSDSVEYVEFNDSLGISKALPLREVVGVKYENGSVFKTKYSKLNLNKLIIEATRTNKRGLHVEFGNTIGFGGGYYVNQPYSTDDNYYESDIGLMAQSEVNAKFYITNVFGVKSGFGYNYKYYYVSGAYSSNYHANYFIHNAVIPIKFFLTPGNKFGFYVDGGVSFVIPFSAYYNETYTVNNREISRSSDFLREVSPFSLYISGTIGLHATIKEKIIIFGGLTQGIGLYNFNATGFNMGVRIGVSYHLVAQKK